MFKHVMKGLVAMSLLTGVYSDADEAKLLRKSYVSELDNKARDYFLYLPKGYHQQAHRQWPVMLFLHGNGERGNGKDQLDFVLHHGPLYEAWIQKQDFPFIIVSPQLHMFDFDKVGYIANRRKEDIPFRQIDGVPPRNFQFETPDPLKRGSSVEDMSAVPPLLPKGWETVESDLLAILQQVQQTYRTDKQRTYLSGLSYGAFGSWYMASKHPHLFAAMVPVVGWGHPSLMKPLAQAKLPIWVFAGGRDRSIDIKYFYAGINQLEQLGHDNVRFTVHEDMGHDTWTRVYQSHDLYDWLLQQKKTGK